jgi:hypothetical protein
MVEDRVPFNEMTPATPLIDGKYYDLGACWCRWSKEHGVFLGGNYFVAKGNTRFAGNPVA